MVEKKPQKTGITPNFEEKLPSSAGSQTDRLLVWLVKRAEPEAEVHLYNVRSILKSILTDFCFAMLSWLKNVTITAALLILGTIPIWGFRPETGFAALLIHLTLEVWGEVVKKVRT